MKKKLRKFLSQFMALMILVCCFAVTVAAEDKETPTFSGSGDSSLTIHTDRTNRSFDLYQIFYGDYTKTPESHTLTEVQWGVSISGNSAHTTGCVSEGCIGLVTEGSYDFSSEIIGWLQSKYLPDGTDNPLYDIFAGKENLTAAQIAQLLAECSNGSLTNSSKNAEAFAMICGEVIQSHTFIESEYIVKINDRTLDKDAVYYHIEKKELSQADYSEGTGYEFKGIHDGYYLICDDTYDLEDLKSQMKSRYILQVAGPSVVSIKLPSEPTLEKKILLEDGTLADFTQAAIGDEITFQITGNLPDMKDFNNYYYIVTDDLYKGFTFQRVESVTIGDKELEPTADDHADGEMYQLLTTQYNDCFHMEFVFCNMKQYQALKGETDKDVTIKVVYTATLNENCYVGSDSVNYNDAYLQFSNDPKHIYKGINYPSEFENSYMGTTPKTTVYAYTTGIRIEKVDQDGYPLTGAQFKIESESLNQLVKKSQVYAAKGYGISSASGNKAYYKLSDGTYTDKAPEGSKEYTAGTEDEVSENEVVPDREFVTYSLSENTYIRDLGGTYYKDLIQDSYVKVSDTTPEKGVHETDVVYYELEIETELFTEKPEESEYYLEVGENGILELDGLKAGIYTITEVKAPTGYNKLENPITIKIDWQETRAVDIEAGCEWSYEVDMEGGTDFEDDASDSDGLFSLMVVNRVGTTLPQTGGVGTVLCYVIGSILVISSSVLLVIRFRRAYKEKKRKC